MNKVLKFDIIKGCPFLIISETRCTICSHSLFCSKNNFSLLGIDPLHKKDLVEIFSGDINWVAWLKVGLEYCKKYS